jgi:hypothetical protein
MESIVRQQIDTWNEGGKESVYVQALSATKELGGAAEGACVELTSFVPSPLVVRVQC